MTSERTDPAEHAQARHPIAVVAERPGLSQDLLRMWERRYEAVRPVRTEGGQRLYSDADVERLRLLDAAVAAGRRIGGIARLATTELARLVEEDRRAERVRATVEPAARAEPERVPEPTVVDRALVHVRALDARALEELLRRSAARHGVPTFLEWVAAPLLRRIGDEWHGRRLSIAQEHAASAVIEAFVVEAMRVMPAPAGAPTVLVATPVGSHHVIAAAMAGAAAAAEGWRVLFLGADLPAPEIALAATASGARVVAVSALYAEAPARLLAELRTLRARLPAEVMLIAGGRAVAPLADELAPHGIEVGERLDDLRALLRRLGGEAGS